MDSQILLPNSQAREFKGIMTEPKYIAFVASVVLLLYIFYRPIRDEVAFNVAHLQTGCYRATRYPHTDRIWGQDLIQSRKKAMVNGRLFPQYYELHQQLGSTWQESFYNERIINTSDVDNIKHVAATESDVFTRMPNRIAASRPLLGTGIFNSVDARWRLARDMLRPAFHRAEIGNVGMMKKHTDRFLALLPRDNSTFDAQPLLKRLFLDMGTEHLFGKSTDSLLPSSSFDATEFLNNLDAALAGMLKRRAAGMMRFKFFFDKTWPEQIRKVHQFIDERVATALDATAQADHNGIVDKASSNRHVLLFEMTQQIRDPIELRYQILNIFLPGRDTIAVLLSNTLFELARHPAEWTHLRKWLKTRPPSEKLTFESLKSMTPLLDVLHETIRLLGPGGRSSKWTSRSSVLPSGGGPDGKRPVFVPQGTGICLLTAVLHRDPQIWGPDANEFNPRRWRQMQRPMKWEFLPFLGGPGICPAQQLALVQAVYVLYRLVESFEAIENRDPVLEYVEQARMLIESRNGAMIAFTPSCI